MDKIARGYSVSGITRFNPISIGITAMSAITSMRIPLL